MKALILAIFAFVVTAPGYDAHANDKKADKLVAVVNGDNNAKKISKATMKAMFLGQTSFWGSDVRVKPFNRIHAGPAGKLFFKQVLGMAPSRYRHHWQKLQLSKQGVEPDVIGTPAALVSKVGGGAGAIGYMLESETSNVDSRVRIIPIE